MKQAVTENEKKLCTSLVEMIELCRKTKQSNLFFEGVPKQYLDVDKEFAEKLQTLMGELTFIITKYKNCWYHIERLDKDEGKSLFVYEIHDMEEEMAWN